ncbi:Single-stranded DNA-binding protein [Xanthomonas hortorum pv. carotae]|uniref:Single-stranded DNA-binding protein n=5 Tax=Xanthomonas TaxID=338 RepID=A0A6V7CVB2_9XANT|nr:single-stranded DNA binding protein [Xanthomonas hortorum pv. carotae str. M081]CAD0322793.1 Single-stranded DNA-binding protein [Xanthomonas hortorum pv. carotae]CAD0322802.1 Single-stranded DNA-binding protein [Xanthomonas hortorum pv. carotae]
MYVDYRCLGQIRPAGAVAGLHIGRKPLWRLMPAWRADAGSRPARAVFPGPQVRQRAGVGRGECGNIGAKTFTAAPHWRWRTISEISMARGINKVILVGNLGNDPDTKYTQAGMAITRVSLATTSMRKDREGNNQERTEWHRVVFFGKLGEIAGEYLRKGSQVYVEGELRYDKYTGQDGVEKYSTDIVANEMQMLGGRGEGGGGGGMSGDRPQRTQAPRQQQGGGGSGGQGGGQDYAPRRQQPAQQQSAPPMDDFADDDIPF